MLSLSQPNPTPCNHKRRERGSWWEGAQPQNLIGEWLHDLLLTVQNPSLQIVQLYNAPCGNFRCSHRFFFSQSALRRCDLMARPVVARHAPSIIAQSVGCWH